MPLKTFLNLSPERQQQIINVCLEEFAVNDYKSASFTKISNKLGITKGGFYRYFESKPALYNYLLKFSGQIIGKLMEKYLLKAERDIFSVFKEYFLELVAMEKKYPMYLPFMFKAAEDKKNIEKIPQWRLRKMDFLKAIIQNQQKRGYIRKDIDCLTLSFFLHQIAHGILGLCRLKYDLNYKVAEKANKFLSDLPQEKLIREIEDFIMLCKQGMGNPHLVK